MQVIQNIRNIKESEKGVVCGHDSDKSRLSSRQRLLGNFKVASILGEESSNVLIFCPRHLQRNDTATPESTLQHEVFIVIQRRRADGTIAAMESARASFLKKAAYLTNAQSPSTSAHFLAERQALTRSAQACTPSQSLNECQRCGTFAISIWKAAKPAIIESSKKSSSRKLLAKPSTQTVIRRCSACGNIAKLSIDRKVKPARSLKVERAPPASAVPKPRASATSSIQIRDEPKLSSKKRAKVRKDREGLQMLISRKGPSSTTPQMSLTDFMRP